jgi:cholesterol transport system auxiliary component
MLRIIILWLFSFLITACSLLQPVKTTTMQSYLLTENNSLYLRSNPHGKTLLVTTPTAPQWLNTQRMAYQLQSDQINYFAENQWAAPPAELLQPILVHALQQSGIYRTVVVAPFAGDTDQRLDFRLVQMQQAFWQHPSVYQVSIQVQLINEKTNQPIAAKRLTTMVATTSDDPQGGVAAANAAIQQLLPQIISFCRRYAW